MSRGWFVLLALSIGLNAGLVVNIARRGGEPALPPCPMPFICGPEGRSAGGGGLSPEALAERRLGYISRRLHMDDRQREAMKGIMAEMMPRLVEGRGLVQDSRRAIRDAYLESSVDPAVIRARTRKLNEAQAYLDSLVAETILRETALLTPEQRTLYFRAMPWEGPPPGGRHEHRGGRRGRR